MTPGTYHFTAYIGATFNELIAWKDGAGADVDLNGYAARMEVRDSQGELLIALDTETGGIEGQEDGTLRLFVDDDVTRTWTADSYVYDLLLRGQGTNVVFVLLRGKFVVKSLVTVGEPGGDVA